MNARRSLTPAARGVSLAVLAALRAGRVDLADQADGSTLATSTAPDGTELLRATLRMPVRGSDPQQLTLGAVSLTPQPAEVPPAPVAVPAGEEREPEAPAPQGDPVRCWVFRRDWDEAQFRDAEAEGWLCEPVAGTVLDWAEVGPWESVLVPAGVLDALRKVCRRVGVTLYESDDIPPVPAKAEPARLNGLASGDLIELDGARVRVAHVDGEGFTWAEVNRDGFPVGEVERCLWREVEHLGETRWRILPVDTETPSAKAKREKAAKRAKAAPKARPARLEEVPEADALARYGERSIVAQLHEGDAWGLVWSDKLPGQMTYQIAVESVLEQAHAARIYDRGKHCTRDSRDGAT